MRTKTMVSQVVTALAAVAAMAGAATVRYDMDASVEFGAFRKVAFARAPSKGADAIADERVRGALQSGLEAKGYTMAPAGEADLTLEYFAVVRQRRELLDTGGPWYGRNLQLRSHPEGTLVIAFTERESGEVVWQGAVTNAIASSPGKADKRTEKAVAALLRKLPAPERD